MKSESGVAAPSPGVSVPARPRPRPRRPRRWRRQLAPLGTVDSESAPSCTTRRDAPRLGEHHAQLAAPRVRSVRILIRGMSGTGKSAVVAGLRRRGQAAFDADYGFSTVGSDGRWVWQVEAVQRLLARHDDALLFFAGCSDEQRCFSWDRRVVLTVPEDVLLARLSTRSSNDFGRNQRECDQVLADRRAFEPVLMAGADLVVDTRRPLSDVVDAVLSVVPAAGKPRTSQRGRSCACAPKRWLPASRCCRRADGTCSPRSATCDAPAHGEPPPPADDRRRREYRDLSGYRRCACQDPVVRADAVDPVQSRGRETRTDGRRRARGDEARLADARARELGPVGPRFSVRPSA